MVDSDLGMARHLSLVAASTALLTVSGCPEGTPLPTGPVDRIALHLVADGFVAPVGMAAPYDGTGRLFILDQIGLVYILDETGERLDEPFLDLRSRMVDIGIDFGDGDFFDERGLLGLAFHPDFAVNGRFFVFYTAPKDEDDPEEFDSENHVSEFRVSADNANRADEDSERLLLEIDKPQFNHNGGQIAFGPDGFLYISVGDGGAANDEGTGHTEGIGNGQDKSTFHGKILRIDVDSGDPYGIPDNNPFRNQEGARPEIYALGMRNPWRFSFASDGRLFVADVGQDLYEEVDMVTRGGNYGWRIREATWCFDTADPSTPPASCPAVDADGDPLIDPILEYPHFGEVQPRGIAVTGGYVYAGEPIPGLQGEYVFGDWSTGFDRPDGSIYAAAEQDDGSWIMRELAVEGGEDGRINKFVLSFGVDTEGELYVLTSANFGPTGTTGEVWHVGEASSSHADTNNTDAMDRY